MLRILAYHRVAKLRDTPAVDSRSVSATPGGFAQQMEHLARFYRVVSMPEVLEAVEKGRPLPKRAVLITFDDAYADFAEIAWPILKQFRLHATMFVPTAYSNQPERAFWWDRLYQAFAATSRTKINVSPLGHLPLLPPDQKRRSLRLRPNECERRFRVLRKISKEKSARACRSSVIRMATTMTRLSLFSGNKAFALLSPR